MYYPTSRRLYVSPPPLRRTTLPCAAALPRFGLAVRQRTEGRKLALLLTLETTAKNWHTMPPRKSDPARRSDAPSASLARFAPIEDVALPSPAPPMQAPTPATPAAPGVHPSPALALPTMDTSMPPPSLPPPGSAQTQDAVVFPSTRPGSGSAASVPSVGGAPAHTTPSSDKGKEREEGGKSGPGGHPKEAVTIPIEVRETRFLGFVFLIFVSCLSPGGACNAYLLMGTPRNAQELQLPKSIITRLAKGVLPPNTQIQANAILAMTKSATVFINHLANAYGRTSPSPLLPFRKGLRSQADAEQTGPTRPQPSGARKPSCRPMSSAHLTI